jgi:hypothetical protein
LNFNPKAPPVYKPTVAKLFSPPVYRPQAPRQNLQLRPAGIPITGVKIVQQQIFRPANIGTLPAIHPPRLPLSGKGSPIQLSSSHAVAAPPKSKHQMKKEAKQRVRDARATRHRNKKMERDYQARAGRRAELAAAHHQVIHDERRLLQHTAKGANLSETLRSQLPEACFRKIVQLEHTFAFSQAAGRIVYRKNGPWSQAVNDFEIFSQTGTPAYYARARSGKSTVETVTYPDGYGGEITVTLRHGSRSSESQNVSATIEISARGSILEFKYTRARGVMNEPLYRDGSQQWSRAKAAASSSEKESEKEEEEQMGFSLFD